MKLPKNKHHHQIRFSFDVFALFKKPMSRRSVIPILFLFYLHVPYENYTLTVPN